MKKEYKLQNGQTAVFEYDENGIGEITVEAMDYLIDMLPRWIPCFEKLPEEEKEVLVYTTAGEMLVAYRFCDWGNYVWTTGGLGSGTVSVIAWMPLPEPYKGDSK